MKENTTNHSPFTSVAHHFQLRPGSSPTSPVEIEEYEEWEVNDILNSHTIFRDSQYLVEWVGWNAFIWQIISDLANAPDNVQHFRLFLLPIMDHSMFTSKFDCGGGVCHRFPLMFFRCPSTSSMTVSQNCQYRVSCIVSLGVQQLRDMLCLHLSMLRFRVQERVFVWRGAQIFLWISGSFSLSCNFFFHTKYLLYILASRFSPFSIVCQRALFTKTSTTIP